MGLEVAHRPTRIAGVRIPELVDLLTGRLVPPSTASVRAVAGTPG